MSKPAPLAVKMKHSLDSVRTKLPRGGGSPNRQQTIRQDHPNVNIAAARTVAKTIAKHEKPIPSDLEAAWEQWSSAVKNVDARGMAQLQAAFKAGFKAGSEAAKSVNMKN